MKKILCMLWLISIQNMAFSESFGIFKADWNRVPVNQLVTINYTIVEKKERPEKEKSEIRDAISSYRRWVNASLSGARLYEDESQMKRMLEAAVRKYIPDPGMLVVCSAEYQCERLAEVMNEAEIRLNKSSQVLVRAISVKFINSEFGDWKAALKGEKIRHCAITVDVDWQGVPSPAKGEGEIPSSFDVDSVYLGIYCDACKLQDAVESEQCDMPEMIRFKKSKTDFCLELEKME